MSSRKHKNQVCSFGNHQYMRALMTSLIAAIGSLTMGTATGYAALAINNINSNPNPFHVSKDQYSWYVSIGSIGCILGCMSSSGLMDTLGRKLTLMLGALPVVTAWAITVGAQNMAMMYTGTVVGGFGSGILIPVAGVYISETASPQIRGRMATIEELSNNIGTLFTYVMGNFLPWTWLGVACASWACVFVVATAFVLPESPRWLIYKGRQEEAVDVLVWLRCAHETEVAPEVNEIQKSLQKGTEIVPWSHYFKPPLLKYFVLCNILFFFHQFTGISVLRSYIIVIFNDAGGVHLSSSIQTVIVGVLMVVGTVICATIADHIERKTLLITSASIMGFGMCTLGTYFKILDMDPIFATTYLSAWLPLLSMVLATVGFEVGCGPLPHILTSECFSTQARSRANGAGCISLVIAGFLQSKFFPDISDALGLAGTFWFFAAMCVLEIIVGLLMVPKTRNKTLEMIQRELEQNQ